MKPEQGKVPKPRRESSRSASTNAAAVHELNNLLTLVLGYGQLIVDGTKGSEPNRHNAEQILRAGERAAVLTRQMAESIGRARNRASRPCAEAGHSTSQEKSEAAAVPVPDPSRRAARRG